MSSSHHIHIPLATLAKVHPKCNPEPLPLDFTFIVQNLALAVKPSPDCVFNRVPDASPVQSFLLAISFEVFERFPMRVSLIVGLTAGVGTGRSKIAVQLHLLKMLLEIFQTPS